MIGFFEETLFRGLFLKGLAKNLPVVIAIVISAFYFAALHFLNSKTEIPLRYLTVFSGFQLLREALLDMFNPAILQQFFALMMTGIFLAMLRTQFQQSLGLCIGCHAGWVWLIKLDKDFFNTDFTNPSATLVSSYDGVIGPLVTGWLLLAVLAYVGDYADLDVPMLSRMFERRCAGYEAVGYALLLPASALRLARRIPCPLTPSGSAPTPPASAAWYGTVWTLLWRTSSCTSLNLCPLTPRAPRARSASEAFLYRRLQTLPTTARFRLNAVLPIPFDTQGRMEVDLLCEGAPLVIEVDGPQHLADPDAYRRDRRKDATLQEHGYFVLRFLAEDLGKNLDDVLDTIQRALAHLDKPPGGG